VDENVWYAVYCKNKTSDITLNDTQGDSEKPMHLCWTITQKVMN